MTSFDQQVQAEPAEYQTEQDQRDDFRAFIPVLRFPVEVIRNFGLPLD